jgi:acid phosphatase
MKRAAIASVAAVAALIGLTASGSRPSIAGENGKPTLAWPQGLPVYDHIVIVIEENKDYDQIIDSPDAPYINWTLRPEGANFTQMYGEEHNSQGNYFWLFSGSNQNVGFKDSVPKQELDMPNLGNSLIAKGRSFKGYSENLPEIGSKDVVGKGPNKLYARKHVPWISFKNVPNTTGQATSSNLRFCDFPADPANYDSLPTIAFVIPNLENDMHNGQPEQSIPTGDAWLKKNIDPYFQWSKNHNSLLIVTFDESDDKSGYVGLTNPFVLPRDQYRRDLQNHIPTIFAGAHIRPDDYPEGKGITHVNILRTLEAMYGLPPAGAQQPNAAGGGITDHYISDVFEKPER